MCSHPLREASDAIIAFLYNQNALSFDTFQLTGWEATVDICLSFAALRVRSLYTEV